MLFSLNLPKVSYSNPVVCYSRFYSASRQRRLSGYFPRNQQLPHRWLFWIIVLLTPYIIRPTLSVLYSTLLGYTISIYWHIPLSTCQISQSSKSPTIRRMLRIIDLSEDVSAQWRCSSLSYPQMQPQRYIITDKTRIKDSSASNQWNSINISYANINVKRLWYFILIFYNHFCNYHKYYKIYDKQYWADTEPSDVKTTDIAIYQHYTYWIRYEH